MKFNYMTELSATILELIYENIKNSVTQNNQPVNGEHQQTNWKEHLKFYKIFWWWTLLLLSTCIFFIVIAFLWTPLIKNQILRYVVYKPHLLLLLLLLLLLSGPDKLPGRLLQSLANEVTPVVHFIFTQSLCTGELPTEWTQANVAPIFKKGSKLQAVNYRPVSLTCITCNLF